MNRAQWEAKAAARRAGCRDVMELIERRNRERRANLAAEARAFERRTCADRRAATIN